MSLCLLPQRTDAATRANAVRRPLFAYRLLARVALDDHNFALAIIIGRRQTPVFGFAQYLTQRLDSGAQAWVMQADVSPAGLPKLEVIAGGRP